MEQNQWDAPSTSVNNSDKPLTVDTKEPDRHMTPERYFENKTKKEFLAIKEEDETQQEEKWKKERAKKRKHVRKPLSRRIQKENLVIAAGKCYHCFYDEVNSSFSIYFGIKNKVLATKIIHIMYEINEI